MDDVQRNITAFWSGIADQYEAHPGNVAEYGSEEYRIWVDTIKAALPDTPADVVDVATGTGFVALIAAVLGHRVTGIDLAETMVAEATRTAKERGLAVRFGIGDAVAPDLPPESVDVVTNRHLLWTLREPETAIRNWWRLLRPGGRVVAIDGLWFEETAPPPPAAGVEPGPFDRHYTAETRAALPFMHGAGIETILAVFGRAGFSDVSATELTSLVNADTGDTPFLIVARR